MKYTKVTESSGILTLSLNRPEVRNAFNPEMIEEISNLFMKVQNRNDLRGVVLRGEGKAFCAGGDLNWMKEMVQFDIKQNKKDAEKLFEMFNSIYQCELPVVGIAHGSVFGGGIGLVACCDFVVAEEQTQFCFSEVKLGIAPAVISHFLNQKISTGVLNAWMTSGMVFGAQDAKQIGLVHLVADEESFQDRIETVVNAYRANGPKAVQKTKELLKKIPLVSIDQRRDLVIDLISQLRVSEEGQEGLKSFLEKRNPNWRTS